MPKVAVIMSAKNAGPTIGSAISSILFQSLPDFSLIVVDDGSTDDTEQIVRTMAERDPRVVLKKNPNSGIYSARNAGIESTDSEYIATMDADDLSLPNRFEEQAGRMDSDKSLSMVGSRIVWFGTRQGMPAMVESRQACRAAMFVFNPLCHPSTFIRRTALDRVGPYRSDYSVAGDYDLMCRLSDVGGVENLPTPLLMYRVHDTQVTSTRRVLMRQITYKILNAHHGRALNRSTVPDWLLVARMAAYSSLLGPANARQSLRAIRSVIRAIAEHSPKT